ncbi:DUF2065 domain-containing protein [uncultured Thalassolituus sp.]|uniref:DUF2065 domain-containing protein n=1 Tax=uncultured Thalassolituus sp. TaxID=285273 RepID=UPI0026164B97|nr:DUF2065 domain-containing protein [uncultured Thalassolituus sp.]
MSAEAWHTLAGAVSLVLIIEGVIPFLYPARWRQLVIRMAETDDRTMRMIGLFSMSLGLILLYLFNN